MWGSRGRERIEHRALTEGLGLAAGDAQALAVEAVEANTRLVEINARLLVQAETHLWIIGLMTVAGSCAGIAFCLDIANVHSSWQAAGYGASYLLVIASGVLIKVKNGSGPLWKRNVETVKDNLLLTAGVIVVGLLFAYFKVPH